MPLEVITTLEAFAGLRDTWNAVLRESGSYTPQMSYEWLAAYWKHFAADAQVEILVHRDKGGGIVGFSPFMTRRRRDGLSTVTELTFLADDLSDYLDFVSIEKCRGEVLVNQVIPFLAERMKQVDRVFLRRIRFSSPNWKFLKRQWSDAFLPTGENPIAVLGTSADEFFGSLGRNIRRELQKRQSRVKESGLHLSFEAVSGYDSELLSEFAEMDRIRAAETGHHSALSRKRVAEFFRDAAQPLAARGEICGWVLRLEGELASYRLGFVVADQFLDWQTSYNGKFNEFDVGKILLAKAIEDCISKKYEQFNFLAGCEGYKLSWSNKIDFFYAYTWERRNVSMRLMDTIRSVKRLVDMKQ